MTTQTFERDNFTVVVSLGDRSVYVKLTDNVNFVAYERNVDQKELQLPQLELGDIYQLLLHCLRGTKPDYDVTMTVTGSGTMHLKFAAVVGGYLNLRFNAILQEKVLSNDQQLSSNFYRMEQKYGALLKRLEELERQYLRSLDALGNAEVYLGEITTGSYQQMSYRYMFSITSESIVISSNAMNFPGNHYDVFYVQIDSTKIAKFFQLQSLSLNGNHWNKSKIDFENRTLCTLTLDGVGNLTTLEGIKKLPLLSALTVNGATSLTNVPAVLSSYKHNIEELTFKGCTAINVVELQTYCQTNGIKLNIS
jgi:hypothetical protein